MVFFRVVACRVLTTRMTGQYSVTTGLTPMTPTTVTIHP